MWKYYALLAAFCAALTAIFSKLGVKDIDAGVATAIRVFFILILVTAIVICDGSLRAFKNVPVKNWAFLLLSAVATGFSWLFYFKALESGDVSRVAPIDKLSVPITIIFAVIFLGEPISWKIIFGGGLITAGVLILL